MERLFGAVQEVQAPREVCLGGKNSWKRVRQALFCSALSAWRTKLLLQTAPAYRQAYALFMQDLQLQ